MDSQPDIRIWCPDCSYAQVVYATWPQVMSGICMYAAKALTDEHREVSGHLVLRMVLTQELEITALGPKTL